MSKIEHTQQPWEFRVYSEGCTIVSKHTAPGRSVRDALKGVQVRVAAEINDDQSNVHEASPDARLLALAPTAPHECSHKGCPGDLNRRRLEMLDELAEAAEQFIANAPSDPFSEGNDDHREFWGAKNHLRSLLASYKELSDKGE